jgi:AAA+ superfamily predicted ATPase
MATHIKNKILQSIGLVFEKSEGSKLEDNLFRQINSELEVLAGYFRVSRTQAFFLAHIFALNYQGDTVDFSDLVKHLKCNPMKLLVYSKDLEVLKEKRLVKSERSRHRPDVALSNDQLTINEKVTHAILNDQPLPEIQNRAKNVLDVLEKIYELGRQSEDKEIYPEDIYFMSNSIIESHLEYPLLKKVYQMKLDRKDAFLFLYIVWETVTGHETVSIGSICDIMFRRPVRSVMYAQELLNNENELVKQDLVEIVPESFFADNKLKLTDISLRLLHESGLKLSAKNTKNMQVTRPADINYKPLFYNEENQQHIDLVHDLLREENLQKTRQRLRQKNLPEGVTILLYGPPGTGKTETILQLAKSTNREIIQVDISHSKSFWYGESEKIIKKIFTGYKSYARQCEVMPILLFNEADAIITKRVDRSHPGGGNQTENAIQNIILEELENIEGIFIATTNLAENLDTAFERRFLFKIRLDIPGILVKAKIWKSKLPHLSDDECGMLASAFNLSGGQIDNVVRKYAMHEILYGTLLSVNEIAGLCREEQLMKNSRNRIGFLKN